MATDSSARLRAAVIGCGPIGSFHAQAVAHSPRAILSAVCDTNPERAKAAAKGSPAKIYTNLRALLDQEELDVVTIATPDHLHVEVTLAALSAGCHVFCEKPLAASVREARQMVDSAKMHDLHLGVDYNRRFGFGYLKAKELLSAGRIGEVGHAVIRVTDHTPPPHVIRHPHVILTNLLTHHLDLLSHFCGEIKSVHARFASVPPEALKRNGVLSLACAGGAVGTIIAGYQDGQERTSEWMALGGAKGTLIVEDVTRRVLLHETGPDRREVFQPNHFIQGDAFYDSLKAHVGAFLEHVADGKAPPVTGLDGLRGLEIVDAAMRSEKEGRSVEV